jgi:hypothetical protein
MKMRFAVALQSAIKPNSQQLSAAGKGCSDLL